MIGDAIIRAITLAQDAGHADEAHAARLELVRLFSRLINAETEVADLRKWSDDRIQRDMARLYASIDSLRATVTRPLFRESAP